MHATQALDYLVLEADKKTERTMPIKEWHSQFQAERITRHLLSYEEAKAELGLSHTAFSQKLNAKEFGDVKVIEGKQFVRAKHINAIRKKEAKLIPIPEICRMLEKGDWYINSETFKKEFRNYFVSGFNKRTKYIRLTDAAKIFRQLRLRKDKIVSWPTFKDLNEQSGINLSEARARARYSKMVVKGKLEAEEVLIYGENGKPSGGRQYKIPPREFQRILRQEKEFAKLIYGEHHTTKSLAQEMKINKEYVSHMITLAEVAGIFQPVRFALNGPSQQYVLSTEQAKMIRERAHFLLEVQVPSNKASLEYFIAKQTAYQNVLKNGGMDVAQLAKALGKKESTAKDLICRGEKAELLHPVRAQGRSYALLAKEIEELISGEIKVPVKKRVRYMTARQIAEKSGISIKSVLRRIKAGELLGYFHPSKKGTHKLPLEEATIIINGTLDLPWKKISEAKTVEEAENYAKQYQKVKELENSGGMRTEQIAQKLGILPTTLATKIQTGVKLGVINPYRTRDHAYLLHPQEAEMIISGKLQLPELRVIKRREAKQTILTARRQDIRNLDLNIVPYTAERELIQKAVHGDNIAMRILKEIYKEEIKDAAKSAYVHSSSYLDRRQMSEVAFYEVLCEADTRKVRADLPELLQEKMKERNKEETATWGPKLESPLKGSPGRTLHDKIAETTITNGFY